MRKIQQAVFRQGLEESQINTVDPRTQLCTALRRGKIDETKIPGRDKRFKLLKDRAEGILDPYHHDLPEDLASDLFSIAESRLEDFERRRFAWIEE
ncbi:MAG TPA: hypothetical protein VF189_05875 [Patescibacteria group bacterium]